MSKKITCLLIESLRRKKKHATINETKSSSKPVTPLRMLGYQDEDSGRPLAKALTNTETFTNTQKKFAKVFKKQSSNHWKNLSSMQQDVIQHAARRDTTVTTILRHAYFALQVLSVSEEQSTLSDTPLPQYSTMGLVYPIDYDVNQIMESAIQGTHLFFSKSKLCTWQLKLLENGNGVRNFV